MRYDTNKKCLKCYQYNDYLFYCEDCGGTFCNCCIVSEKTDCTYSNECAHISIGNKCELCGKINHLSAEKTLKRCPMCSSSKIKDSKRKVDGLSEEFSSNVNLLSTGLDTIKSFASKYSDVVTAAKHIRRERFGLYPNIEGNLLRIQDLFYEIIQRASEILDKVSQHIYQDAKTLIFNQNISVSKLRGIDKTLKIIKTHALSYSNILTDYFSDPLNELEDIEGKVKELKTYSELFDNVVEKFEPELYELKIAAFPNIKMAFPSDRRKKVGTLFITNKKMYFLPRSKLIKKNAKSIPISMIKDVDSKRNIFSGYQLIINMSERNIIKIKCTDNIITKLKFIFGILFNENENYVVTDPYMMENYRVALSFSHLKDKLDKRIKDLKEIPFSPSNYQLKERPIEPRREVESEEVMNLKIELKAAKDTLRELIKAFNDRSITPEVYFSRREKTTQKIYMIEQQLKEAQKASLDFGFTDLLRYYQERHPTR
ncbi:MAG: hypothetical protein FK732_01135 [Asgard group archaeon]|nr:hypothetical protein [Asgard group archaeon]